VTAGFPVIDRPGLKTVLVSLYDVDTGDHQRTVADSLARVWERESWPADTTPGVRPMRGKRYHLHHGLTAPTTT
jgi:hypothetical protein